MILSKPFVALVTAWRYNTFFRSRIVLTGFYAVILWLILSLNAFFVYLWSQSSLDGLDIISVEQVKDILDEDFSWLSVDEIELEKEWGSMIYSVEFAKWKEIHIDAVTWHVFLADEDHGWLRHEFLESFTENLIYINLIMFLIGVILSYLLAGKTLAPIKVKMDEQDRFVADAAHELRNPLAAIRISLENLITKANKKDVEKILDETVRLSDIAEDLLSLSHENQNHKAKKDISIWKICDRAMSELLPYAESRKVMMVVTWTDIIIKWDKSAWQKVIYNLTHNAIKFADKETDVVLSIEKNKLSVTNMWSIISKQEASKIFDRFYKSDKARTTSQDSWSGIWLSIVKQVVENHGYKIEVTSSKKTWTTFTIFFR